MMRLGIPLVALFLLLATSVALRAETVEQQFQSADAELNRVYGELRAALADAQKEQLKQSQRQWISERDSLASSAMSQDQRLEILTSKTMERTAVLRKALASLQTPHGDDSHASADFQAADQELNRLYRELRDLSPQAERDNLKESQRRWIQAKERSASDLSDPQRKNDLLLRLTRQRTSDLSELVAARKSGGISISAAEEKSPAVYESGDCTLSSISDEWQTAVLSAKQKWINNAKGQSGLYESKEEAPKLRVCPPSSVANVSHAAFLNDEKQIMTVEAKTTGIYHNNHSSVRLWDTASGACIGELVLPYAVVGCWIDEISDRLVFLLGPLHPKDEAVPSFYACNLRSLQGVHAVGLDEMKDLNLLIPELRWPFNDQVGNLEWPLFDVGSSQKPVASTTLLSGKRLDFLGTGLLRNKSNSRVVKLGGDARLLQPPIAIAVARDGKKVTHFSSQGLWTISPADLKAECLTEEVPSEELSDGRWCNGYLSDNGLFQVLSPNERLELAYNPAEKSWVRQEYNVSEAQSLPVAGKHSWKDAWFSVLFANGDPVGVRIAGLDNKANELLLWPSGSGFGKHSIEVVAGLSPDGERAVLAVNVAGSSLGDYYGELCVLKLGKTDFLSKASGEEYAGITAAAFVAHDPAEQSIVCGFRDGRLALFDTEKGAIQNLYDDQEILSVKQGQITADGSLIAAGRDDGAISLVRYNSAEGFSENTRLYVFQDGNMLLFDPDSNSYAGRVRDARVLAFAQGTKVYPFEQFDVRLNRPDIVLERLGAPADAIAIAKQLREKRLKRMGVTEEMLKPDFHVPELEIVGGVPSATDGGEINLSIKASDSKYPLERLKVYVNNVPVNGRDGELLREESKTNVGLLGRITGTIAGATTGPQSLERTIPIKLAAGRNKIQVSVLNNAGAESLYANAEINCTAKRPKPTLYAVAMGVSEYSNPDWNLKYAAKDARDVLARLKDKAGDQYGEAKELLLTDKEVTKENLAKVREFLKGATIDDTVLMFAAGHGLLDSKYDYYFGTADIDFNNPSDKGIAFEEFDDILADLPCLKKSLLVDTCHAGELDQDEKALLASASTSGSAPLPTGKGIAMRSIGTRGMNVKAIEGARGASEWYDRLQGLFVDLRRGSGSTIITSAAGAEYALESSEQQNGLFTYAVLEALDGKPDADTNKDGSVQMSELGEYVKKRVSELTNNKQTPNTRRVNLEGDFVLAKIK